MTYIGDGEEEVWIDLHLVRFARRDKLELSQLSAVFADELRQVDSKLNLPEGHGLIATTLCILLLLAYCPHSAIVSFWPRGPDCQLELSVQELER